MGERGGLGFAGERHGGTAGGVSVTAGALLRAEAVVLLVLLLWWRCGHILLRPG